jgi:HEAT repeat protein
MHARRWIMVATVAVLVLILVWAVLHRREPVYEGKTLSTWVQQGRSNQWRGAAADEARFAIRQIGTNSIPFLVNLIRATDGPVKRKLRTVLPPSWHAALHLKNDSGETRRIGAHGLVALGSNAPSAVPALIEIATNHPDPDGRYIAVFALRSLRSAAEAAVPFFIQCLTNSDSAIRNEAAVGLVLVPRQWDVALPHLVRYLDSIKATSGWEITHLIDLFGMYLGTNVQPAVPILLSLLNHEHTQVRESVRNALPRIDPEAASKAGVVRR